MWFIVKMMLVSNGTSIEQQMSLITVLIDMLKTLQRKLQLFGKGMTLLKLKKLAMRNYKLKFVKWQMFLRKLV